MHVLVSEALRFEAHSHLEENFFVCLCVCLLAPPAWGLLFCHFPLSILAINPSTHTLPTHTHGQLDHFMAIMYLSGPLDLVHYPCTRNTNTAGKQRIQGGMHEHTHTNKSTDGLADDLCCQYLDTKHQRGTSLLPSQ